MGSLKEEENIMEKLLGSMIENKKIAILGYGREGKSTLKVLLRIGGYESITILDKNVNGQDISEDMNVTVVSGEGYQDRLDDYDMVIKSPGVVLDRDIESYKCDIVSQTELFMRRYKGQVIGITGTKGKSTTTTLIYHILQNMGWDAKLAGNVGIPSFDIIDDIRENTIIVYELSSHMLEYMSVSPRIGVILNIYEEHLDHYGTMEKYVKAKKNILTNQEEGDICFLHRDIHYDSKSTRIRITTDLKNTYDNGEVNIHRNVVTFCYNEESLQRKRNSL
jgi:UDP-N-acetylmuramoylalanine--D-glutamate ligase